jgi:hypothetical protein
LCRRNAAEGETGELEGLRARLEEALALAERGGLEEAGGRALRARQVAGHPVPFA